MRLLGNCRMYVLCQDGISRLCHIRGKIKSSSWIKENDIVLISIRDYQEDRGDIIYKYNTKQISEMIKNNELEFE